MRFGDDYCLMFRLSSFLLVAALLVPALLPAQTAETIFFDAPADFRPHPIPAPTAQLLAVANYPNDPNRFTFIARLYTPNPNVFGPGPYPAAVVVHGSGGMWIGDVIASGIVGQFRQWGELLRGLGYIVLVPDSYNPRGIAGDFANRRPHDNDLIDDALCSPNYERPKDIVAALAYLNARGDVDMHRTALIGFSHGAQTILNVIVDESVDLTPYTVTYIDEHDDEIDLEVPSPVRIPDHLPFPKLCAAYYPGGSHYAYHGQASSVVAGRYMADRRTRVLLFHGTNDSLLGVDDPDIFPLTGNLFPIKQALSSGLQAATLGLPNPIVQHYLFDEVEHSFDGAALVAEADWNTINESADQKAKRLSRTEVLKWLDYRLNPIPRPQLEPTAEVMDREVTWPTSTHLRYVLKSTTDLVQWSTVTPAFDGTGLPAVTPVTLPDAGAIFYRVEYGAIPPPVDDPDHAGFFLDYGDFSY